MINVERDHKSVILKMSVLNCNEFFQAAEEFVRKSTELSDGWKLVEDKNDILHSYIKKETYLEHEIDNQIVLLKAEYIIFYNMSYGVPTFSFNIWNACGMLWSLENIRKMSFIKINEKDFYSVITQQEHPIFHRPYFIVHPCHTETLLLMFKNTSKNIIVTFLGLITPLIKINLPLEYGL